MNVPTFLPRSAGLALALIISLGGANRAAAAEWEALPDMPSGNGSFVAGVMKGKIYLLGGISWENDVKTWRDNIWTFDLKKKTWAEAGHLPGPLAYPSFGQRGAKFLYAGGSDGTNTLTDLWSYTAGAAVPQRLGPLPPLTFLAGHTLYQDRFYCIGGIGEATNYQTQTNLAYALHISTASYEPLPPYPDGNILMSGVTALNGKLYVFGGASVDATNLALNTQKAYAFSITDKIWQPLAPYPDKTRGLSAIPLGNDQILIGGGYENGFVDKTYIYDLRKNAYRPATPLPYAAMSTLFSDGKYLYWVGGEDKGRHRSSRASRIALKDIR